MKKSFSLSRRSLLRSSVLGTAAVFTAAAIPALKSRAADLPHATEDDPVAMSLKYKNDAATSERPDESQFCHNCQYFKGTGDAEWAPCDIFPGKAVNHEGWCNVWTKKA